MPLLNSVTTPYAEALLQVVNENSQTEEMVSEVKQLLELINDSPELELTLFEKISIMIFFLASFSKMGEESALSNSGESFINSKSCLTSETISSVCEFSFTT